jgi:hypothetical protein
VSLLVTILPHLALLFARRLRSGGLAAPTVLPTDGRIDGLDLSDPLIPYDRIYARHWAERKGG